MSEPYAKKKKGGRIIMLGQKVHLENEEANSQKHGTPKTTYVLSESQQNKKLFFFLKATRHFVFLLH